MYLVGSETSFERHFQFDGKSIGLLLTLGEIGPILTAVVISHLGSRGQPAEMDGARLVPHRGRSHSSLFYGFHFPSAATGRLQHIRLCQRQGDRCVESSLQTSVRRWGVARCRSFERVVARRRPSLHHRRCQKEIRFRILGLHLHPYG